MELFRQTNVDFLKYKWWAIAASLALIAVGILAIFVHNGLKFGIDFAGGTQIALRFADRPDIDRLRKLLETADLGETGIQRFEEPEKNQVLIRVQQQAGEGRDVAGDVLRLLRQGLQAPTDPGRIDLNTEGRATLGVRLAAEDPDRIAGKPDVDAAEYYGQVAQNIIDRRSELGLFRSPADVRSVSGISPAVQAWVQANTYTGPFVLLSAENVGPQVGRDLQKKALLAIIWSTIGMLVYIAFRFRSLAFGVGTIVALVHDTLITVGILALLGREFNLVVVAALLTLVGYSANDKVVVFDRVRENRRSPRKEAIGIVINRSINQTLSRTMLTAGATLLVCVALFFLGGDVLNTFALTLIIGIVIGTYSSIYTASAIVVLWDDFRSGRKKRLAVVPAPTPAKAEPAQPVQPAPTGKKKQKGR
jgi:preprotein translocase subunit SecF